MGRRALKPGELGKITTKDTGKTVVIDGDRKKLHTAYARVGTDSGVSVKIQASGPLVAGAKEALEEVARERRHQRSGRTIAYETTIEQFAEMYVASTAKRQKPTRPQTRDHYRRLLRVHVNDTDFGRTEIGRLESLQPDLVRHWLEKKHDEVPTTARMLKNILFGAFKWAIEQRGSRLWSSNPAGGAAVAVRATETRILAPEDVAELRRRAEEWQSDTKPTPAVAILDMLAATGMRVGECLALRWEDLDLDAGIVTVQGTLLDRDGKQADGGGTVRQAHGKTELAHREITLPEWIIPLLLERRVMSEGEKVYPNDRGNWLSPNGFRRRFREFRGKEYSWVTPKTYRATVATMIARELGDVQAAAQLGHASPAVTNQHYIERAGKSGDNTSALQVFDPVVSQSAG